MNVAPEPMTALLRNGREPPYEPGPLAACELVEKPTWFTVLVHLPVWMVLAASMRSGRLRSARHGAMATAMV